METEYDDLEILPLLPDALNGVKRDEYAKHLSPAQKEDKRKEQLSHYEVKRLTCLSSGRTELPLNGTWLFMPSYQIGDSVEAKAISPLENDNDWHVMPVPSFWNPIRIWLHGETMPSPSGSQPKGVSDVYYQQETDRCENYTFDYRKTSSAWYRQWVDLPEGLGGKNMILQFDAVSKACDVYVNGHRAGSHVGMFADFQIDVSQLLRPGRNLIVLKVYRDIKGMAVQSSDAMENYYGSVRRTVMDNKDDRQANQTPITDIPHGFYGDNPAGIWQPVKLVITDPLKIEDVFIKPSLTGATFDIHVKNHEARGRSFSIQAVIKDKTSGGLLYSGTLATALKLNSQADSVYTYSLTNLKPKLWEPSTPNLYDFTFILTASRHHLLDSLSITSGFRTFEARSDGFLYLNGRKYWLRGGNHIPMALRPNDEELANQFMQMMRQGNINATRTHTTPWNELWMSAADRNGIAVSFEGTWPWLMIHSTPIPDPHILSLWQSEWLALMKKYRNHPSLVFWTVNNEMKFYDLDADSARAGQKMRIISNVVKRMRQLDPTRPVCFDSNYTRHNGMRRFGSGFMSTIDDGDIDDNHAYYNWYDYSLFRFFNGEFQRNFKTPGRPLISQEMSTGYPNAETGHPTRSYQLIHQNPFALVGYDAYDWADPSSFLQVQGFITGELAEALRRTGDQCSGMMHFAYMTWIRQHYDARHLSPYPAWYAMQRAMQPVLVSAELWGRHLYEGQKLTTRIYVVNDDEQGRDLGATTLSWTITDDRQLILAHGEEPFPAVPYYGRKYIEPTITMPSSLPKDKVYAHLNLTLSAKGEVLSRNTYDLTLASKQWNANRVAAGTQVVLLDRDGMSRRLSQQNITHTAVPSVGGLLRGTPRHRICIVSGLTDCSASEARQLRAYVGRGGRMIFLNCPAVAKKVFPEYITGWIRPTEGDIVVMERADAPVFAGIDPLDLRYFNNNRREMPQACTATLQVVRHQAVMELASQMKIHAYIDGGTSEDRIRRIESMRGLALLQIFDGKGKALVSTMCTEKADTDPIAARLLVNLINECDK